MSITNIRLLPRPWSGHYPKVLGVQPMITAKIERINRRRKNSWRCTIFVDSNPMSFSHHDTKSLAESKAAGMLDAYTEVHYYSK